MWGKRSKDSLYNRSSVEKRQLLVSRYCSTYVLCYRIRHRYIIHTRIEANININYRVFSLVEKLQSKKCIVTYIIDVSPLPPCPVPIVPTQTNQPSPRFPATSVFHRIFLGPFASITYSLRLIDLPQFGDIICQRIIRIGCTE